VFHSVSQAFPTAIDGAGHWLMDSMGECPAWLELEGPAGCTMDHFRKRTKDGASGGKWKWDPVTFIGNPFRFRKARTIWYPHS